MKRTIFLLEVLIGLSLISILFSSLFTSMSKSAYFEKKVESIRNTLLERQYLQTQLQDLFLSLHSLYSKKMQDEEKESLIAVFHHGIDPDPAFSGPVLARIFLDKEKNLALALWPMGTKEKPRPWRKMILLHQVEDFQFSFFGEPANDSIGTINAKLSWHDHWTKTRSDPPLMIRLSIKQKEGSFSYAFFPSTASFVNYSQDDRSSA